MIEDTIANIRNETGNITADPADTKRIIGQYYEELCTYKFDNLHKMNQ